MKKRANYQARKVYRWFPIKNYMGIYMVNEDKKEVRVARIVYGRRDLTYIL